MASSAILLLVVLAIDAYGIAVLAREAPRPLWPPREPDMVVGRDDPADWKRRRDRIGRGWAMAAVGLLLTPIALYQLIAR